MSGMTPMDQSDTERARGTQETGTRAADRVAALRAALATRVVIADGAMGTMLQASDPTLDDFAGLEGCNEILNVTRPDIVREVHGAYLEAGADCVRIIREQFLRQKLATAEEFDRVACPVGLDIAAVGTHEIAVSILAQLIQKRAGIFGAKPK